MARSRAFSDLIRMARVADYCDRLDLPTKEGYERAVAATRCGAESSESRRDFLKKIASLAAVSAAANGAGPLAQLWGAPAPASHVRIAVVGAGLAGLVCADELRKNGIAATILDANTRVGGRCWSLRNYFPGQVAERGGEFIDTLHNYFRLRQRVRSQS